MKSFACMLACLVGLVVAHGGVVVVFVICSKEEGGDVFVFSFHVFCFGVGAG